MNFFRILEHCETRAVKNVKKEARETEQLMNKDRLLVQTVYLFLWSKSNFVEEGLCVRVLKKFWREKFKLTTIVRGQGFEGCPPTVLQLNQCGLGVQCVWILRDVQEMKGILSQLSVHIFKKNSSSLRWSTLLRSINMRLCSDWTHPK